MSFINFFHVFVSLANEPRMEGEEMEQTYGYFLFFCQLFMLCILKMISKQLTR